jgi:glutamate dehydrogenase
VRSLLPEVDGLVRPVELELTRQRTAELVALGAPEALAGRITVGLSGFLLLDVVDLAEASGRPLRECALVAYAVSDRLDVDRLLHQVSDLPRGDRWDALARQALRDDLYRSLRAVSFDVLSGPAAGGSVDERLDAWERRHDAVLARARTTLAELDRTTGSLAALSVAARQLRGLVR